MWADLMGGYEVLLTEQAFKLWDDGKMTQYISTQEKREEVQDTYREIRKMAQEFRQAGRRKQ